MTKFITSVGLLVSGMAFAAPAPTSTTLSAQSSATTVSAQKEAVKPAAKKITLNYTAENYSPFGTTNHDDFSGFESQQHVGIAYQLSETERIQYRQYFYYNMTDATRSDEWGLGEHVIQYSNSQAWNLGNIPVSSYARLYIPGSDWAKDIGKYELRYYNSVKQVLPNNLEMSYFLNSRFYGYTEVADNQLGLRLMPGVELSYKKVEAITPFVMAFTDHTWRHTGTGLKMDGTTGSNPANGDMLWVEYGIQTKPFKNLSVNFYGETGDNLRDSKDFRMFEEDLSAYYLDIIATM